MDAPLSLSTACGFFLSFGILYSFTKSFKGFELHSALLVCLVAVFAVGAAAEAIPHYSCTAVVGDMPEHECSLAFEEQARMQRCKRMADERDQICNGLQSKPACEAATREHQERCEQDRESFRWLGGKQDDDVHPASLGETFDSADAQQVPNTAKQSKTLGDDALLEHGALCGTSGGLVGTWMATARSNTSCGCHELCMNRTGCYGWQHSATEKQCYLKKEPETLLFVNNSHSRSGILPFDRSIAHRCAHADGLAAATTWALPPLDTPTAYSPMGVMIAKQISGYDSWFGYDGKGSAKNSSYLDLQHAVAQYTTNPADAWHKQQFTEKNFRLEFCPPRAVGLTTNAVFTAVGNFRDSSCSMAIRLGFTVCPLQWSPAQCTNITECCSPCKAEEGSVHGHMRLESKNLVTSSNCNQWFMHSDTIVHSLSAYKRVVAIGSRQELCLND